MSSYTVLGIAPNATDDEVRLAYKHKALECHPDRHVNDKDLATRNFIELNTAYRAVLRERARKAAASQTSTPPEKPAEQQDGVKEPTPPKAAPSASDSSTRSFKSTCSSSSSTPSSTPLSSPFTTPSSSPYSSPASSPASSSTSLPDEADSASTKSSATCDDVDDHGSTACSSTTSHTAKPSSDPGSPTLPKLPRAKLRKQHPKKSQKSKPSSSSSTTSSHDYECHDSRSEPTYTASPTKSSPNHGHSNDHRKAHFKHSTKYKATELKEYYNSLPSLKDYPKVDLAPEWTYPLPLTLEDIFRGKRLCYRIKRRYLTGKTKAVVLDVDVPRGCRSGTKIVFRDAGHERRDGTKQDLVFVVREAKHERFVRGHEWGVGGGSEGRDEGKDEKKDKDRRKRRESQDGDKQEKSSGKKSRKHRKYKEDDLVMEVRLPWVDRLKEEKAKVVVSGVDGKELVFEVDCRSGKGGEKGQDGKMTGDYIVEDAGMPMRNNARSATGGGGDKGNDESTSASANWTGQRGRLIIRWEIFVPASPSSSKWESFKQMLKFGK